MPSLKRCCNTAWGRVEAWLSPPPPSSRRQGSAPGLKQVRYLTVRSVKLGYKVANQSSVWTSASSLHPGKRRPENANLATLWLGLLSWNSWRFGGRECVSWEAGYFIWDHTHTHTPCCDTRWLDYRQSKMACTGRSTLPCFTLPAALTCLSPNLCVSVSVCGGQHTCCGFTLLKSAAQMCRHYKCRLCAQTSLEPTEVYFRFQARSPTSQTAYGTLNYREIL